MSEIKLPIGFSMSVAQNENALNYFANLDANTKNKIVEYIQNSNTGDDAKLRINTTVDCLEKNSLDFLG